MKKITFLLLFFYSIISIGQVSSGMEQEFDYGIKNNAATTVLVPNYVTTQGADGTYGKIEPINLPVNTATQDSLNKKLNISDLPTNLTLYPTTTASDVSGYVVMVKDIHDVRYNTTAVDVSTAAITTTNQLVSQRISDAGVLIGEPGVFNITTFGNIRRLSGSGTATFFFRVYQRTSAGVETLIGESSNSSIVTSASYLEFTASAIWDDGLFLPTDRIVIKSYANRIVGGSDPIYQFQFGGLTPVRTILPVPFSVVDAGYEIKTNKQNSLAVDGTGVKYVTVDAVNADVVKLTGNQTIAGLKDFTNRVKVLRTLADLNYHAFDDLSVLNISTDQGIAGYSSYDSYVTVNPTFNMNHANGYQSRLNFTGSSNIVNTTGYSFNFTHNGTGTINNLYGVSINEPSGTGISNITNKYGLIIGNYTGGYAIYSVGGDNLFGGKLKHAVGTVDSDSALISDITTGTRGGYFSSLKLSNITSKKIPYKVSDATGLIDSPLSSDGTRIFLGARTTNFKSYDLELINSSSQLFLSDNDTDITNKAIRIGLGTYTNANNPLCFLYGTSGSSANILNIGGGTGIMTAPTLINFFTTPAVGTNTGTNRMAITGAGNVLMGTTTDNGVDKLQVNGSTKTTALTLSTAPTTSASTYDILTRNSSTGVVEKVASSTALLWTDMAGTIRNNNTGEVELKPSTKVSILNAANAETATITSGGNFITKTTGTGFYGSDDASGMYFDGSKLNFRCYGDSRFRFNPIYLNLTSSETDVVGFSNSTINPTSGTAIFNMLNISPTVNQTGGANGITRSLYINPTLTAAADFRAIEVTGGNSIFQKVIAQNTIRLKNYTVATLPTGTQGDTAYVTDALAPTYLVTVVGGGAVVCPVFYDGTNWVSH